MKYPYDYINKVICGDCLEIMKDMPDKSIDLVLTDPPYGIDYQSNMRVMSKKFDKLENDNNDSRFLAFKNYYRVMKDNTVLISFCSYKNIAVDYIEIQKYFDIKNVVVWWKGGGGIGDLKHSLSTDYELAIVAHKGKKTINGKREGTVWKINKVPPEQMFHPTEKPYSLLEKFILQFSSEDNIVLDSYSGSGSCLLACQNLHRNFIGIEISQEYCKIAEERLRQKPLF